MKCTKPLRWSPGILLACFLVSGCSTEPADPWAETELSRAAAQVKGMNTIQDPTTIYKQVKGHIRRPNLYDLHHPNGALARLSPIDIFATASILERAGYPIQFDEETLQATVDGRQPHLWLSRDATQIELPATVNRSGYPTTPGLISMHIGERLRVTGGETMSQPLRGVEEVPVFLENWVKHFGQAMDAPPKARLLEADDGVPLTIAADGALQIRGQDVTLDELPRRLMAMLAGDSQPIFVQPAPRATYGRVVQVMDRLFNVAKDGTPVRYALPHGALSQGGAPIGLARRLRPKPSKARILVLKIDTAVPFEKVQPILDTIAERQDRVVLMTQLDLSDKSRITAETWPGGLFGGLTIALAKPTPEQRTRAMERGAGPLRPANATAPAEPEAVASTLSTPPPRRTTTPAFPSDIAHVGGDVQAPVKLSGEEPDYTDIARKARLQGVVIMQVIIDTEGRVQNTKVLKGLPMGLSEEAVKAVRQWTYQPATKNGQPIRVYYNVTVNFRLQ